MHVHIYNGLLLVFSLLGVDWFLATVMAVAICLLFAVNTYIVVLWVDPSDQSASLWQLVIANEASRYNERHPK